MEVVNATCYRAEELVEFAADVLSGKAKRVEVLVLVEQRVPPSCSWHGQLDLGVVFASLPKLEKLAPDPVARMALKEGDKILLSYEQVYHLIPYWAIPSFRRFDEKYKEGLQVELRGKPTKQEVMRARWFIERCRIAALTSGERQARVAEEKARRRLATLQEKLRRARERLDRFTEREGEG